MFCFPYDTAGFDVEHRNSQLEPREQHAVCRGQGSVLYNVTKCAVNGEVNDTPRGRCELCSALPESIVSPKGYSFAEAEGSHPWQYDQKHAENMRTIQLQGRRPEGSCVQTLLCHCVTGGFLK